VNPILLKELRSMLRERRGWLVPMVYTAVLAAAVMIFVLPQTLSPMAQDMRLFGGFLVGLVAVLQTMVLVVAGPLVGASTIAGERERITWLSLLASPVPRRQIATGKLVAACLYLLLLLCVSAPVAALALLAGAIDLPTLAGLYLTHALLGCTLACLGVATSTLFQRTWTAALVAISLAFAGAVFTAAVATSAQAVAASLGEQDLSELYHWVWYFNPGYGVFLFFQGQAGAGGLLHWLGHFAALGLVAAASLAFTVLRLRGLRD